MTSVLRRFGPLIAFALSGFDRLRFRGESRLRNNGRGVESYLFQQRLRCIDFPGHVEELTARLRRRTEADAPKSWQARRQGVADPGRRAAVSPAANNRLAEGLATVAEPAPLGERLKPLGRPVVAGGRRRARALNPLTGRDGDLLRLPGRGAFLVRGFRNADLREALFGATADPVRPRREAARVTRRLGPLRAHGPVVKVTGAHRYHLSAAGRRIVTALAAAHASDITRLTAAAGNPRRPRGIQPDINEAPSEGHAGSPR
jgi:hypothetical protein